MARTKGVSSKTHTAAQCNDYANKHNPNSKAYRAERLNKQAMHKKPNFYLDDYIACTGFIYAI